MLKAFHDDIYSGYQGISQTITAVSRHFFWKSIAIDVRAYVSNCQVCGLTKRAQKDVRTEMKHLPMATSSFYRWSMDFLENLRESMTGYKHVLVCIEDLTRLFVTVPLKNLQAVTIAEALLNKVFLIYGFPADVRSDNGGAWRSTFMDEMSLLLGYKHAFSLS